MLGSPWMHYVSSPSWALVLHEVLGQLGLLGRSRLSPSVNKGAVSGQFGMKMGVRRPKPIVITPSMMKIYLDTYVRRGIGETLRKYAYNTPEA